MNERKFVNRTAFLSFFFFFSKNGTKIKNWIGAIQSRECLRVSEDEIRIPEVHILSLHIYN
jgi:hypothetical protein